MLERVDREVLEPRVVPLDKGVERLVQRAARDQLVLDAHRPDVAHRERHVAGVGDDEALALRNLGAVLDDHRARRDVQAEALGDMHDRRPRMTADLERDAVLAGWGGRVERERERKHTARGGAQHERVKGAPQGPAAEHALAVQPRLPEHDLGLAGVVQLDLAAQLARGTDERDGGLLLGGDDVVLGEALTHRDPFRSWRPVTNRAGSAAHRPDG